MPFKIQTLTLPVVLLACSVMEFQGLTAGEVFSKGAQKDYEVVYPKAGFIGSPRASSASMDVIPQSRDNFETRFLRIIVADVRKLSAGQRAVLRIDEIDQYGRLQRAGLYFTYLNCVTNGIEQLCKIKDDDGDDSQFGITRYEIPYPLTCTRPPVLGFRLGKRAGYINRSGYGVDYTLKDTLVADGTVEVEATHFQKLGLPSDKLPQTIRFHGADIAEVATTNASTSIRYREQQVWDAANDWLWRKMERVDNEGHLLMRCVQVRSNAPQPKTPEDSEKK